MEKSTQVCRQLRRRNNSELVCLVPGTGGISALSQKDPAWQDNKTWVLCSTSSLDPALKAINDYGTHWSIQPSKVLTVQEYKAALSTIEAHVVPFHPLQDPGTILGNFYPYNLNKYGWYNSKPVIIVCDVLRRVVQEIIRVPNWDDNDYTHLAILANSLNAASIRLSHLVYKSDSLLLKKQAVVGAAILAYSKAMDEKIMDEDEESDWANDYILLRSVVDPDSFPPLDEVN